MLEILKNIIRTVSIIMAIIISLLLSIISIFYGIIVSITCFPFVYVFSGFDFEKLIDTYLGDNSLPKFCILEIPLQLYELIGDIF